MLGEKDKNEPRKANRIEEKIDSYDNQTLKQRVSILSNQVSGTKEYITNQNIDRTHLEDEKNKLTLSNLKAQKQIQALQLEKNELENKLKRVQQDSLALLGTENKNRELEE